MVIFIEVKGLSELESAEKWEEARAMLYELWNADRGNVDLFSSGCFRSVGMC